MDPVLIQSILQKCPLLGSTVWLELFSLHIICLTIRKRVIDIVMSNWTRPRISIKLPDRHDACCGFSRSAARQDFLTRFPSLLSLIPRQWFVWQIVCFIEVLLTNRVSGSCSRPAQTAQIPQMLKGKSKNVNSLADF